MTDSGQADGGVGDEQALAQRAAEIRARIATAAEHGGRKAEQVQIVAITKTVSAERLIAAARLGFTTFGENRVQEAREKQEQFAALLASQVADTPIPSVRWELVGHLQTNKAARAVEMFARVQSVDSLRVAKALNERAATLNLILPVLLEVNIGQEESKSGIAPDALVEVARTLAPFSHLRLDGLMTVAPVVSTPEQARPYFRSMRELRDRLRDAVPMAADGGWRELSMGMTDDFEVAIEEGATLVRIGRGLFGARPPLVRAS